ASQRQLLRTARKLGQRAGEGKPARRAPRPRADRRLGAAGSGPRAAPSRRGAAVERPGSAGAGSNGKHAGFRRPQTKESPAGFRRPGSQTFPEEGPSRRKSAQADLRRAFFRAAFFVPAFLREAFFEAAFLRRAAIAWVTPL